MVLPRNVGFGRCYLVSDVIVQVVLWLNGSVLRRIGHQWFNSWWRHLSTTNRIHFLVFRIPNIFHQAPKLFSFPTASVPKFWHILLSLIAIKSRIASASSRISHCILIKSRTVEITFPDAVTNAYKNALTLSLAAFFVSSSIQSCLIRISTKAARTSAVISIAYTMIFKNFIFDKSRYNGANLQLSSL